MSNDRLVRVGITGHTRLTEHSTRLVYDALVLALRSYPAGTLRGVTCLAEGADQIFARAVIAAEGTFEVVLPSRDYRLRCISPGNAPSFDRLLEDAVTVSYACPGTCGSAAYAAANVELLRRSSYLLAVWDGQRAGEAGGTAEVVALAELSGVPVDRVWPAGAERA
jgi:hypothetical protein